MLCADRKGAIEHRAYTLRLEIFDNRQRFWDGRAPRGLEVADPELAALVLGMKFEYRETLDLPLAGVNSKKVAGLLFRKKGLILVAERFGAVVARFTAAHEIGHVVFHWEEIDPVLHRDLPIAGLEQAEADPIEREANYFAACFLMPRKYV